MKITKICTKCKTEQLIDNFTSASYFKKDGTKGKSSRCKSCQREWREKNISYTKQYNKKYYKLKEKTYKWQIDLELGNKSCSKCYKIKPLKEFYNIKKNKSGKSPLCKNCTDQKRKDWIKSEKGHESFNKYNTKYFLNRRKTDLDFKLKVNIRATISHYVKMGYLGKKNKTWEMLNYTPKELRTHLENQFSDKMDWGNYGTYWEIEHATPQSWFDLNNPEEIKKCWALENLYPATIKFNRLKGNKHNFRENKT